MSIKAGRVGVAPDQVDEFGTIHSEAIEGYTKQEADAKFETQNHATSTFQPKTLSVPIEMLSGTKLTVETALQGLNVEKVNRADQNVLGAKNLLLNQGTTKTENGLTFTHNADGSIKVNGTATADTVYIVHSNTPEYNDKDIILTGCPDGGSAGTYQLYARIANSSDGYIRDIHDFGGEGARFTPELRPTGTNLASIRIFVKSGQVLNNKVFKPMLRYAFDPDGTYEPYAASNRDLSEFKVKLTIDLLAASSFEDFKNRMNS